MSECKCSLCGKKGHNKRTCNNNNKYRQKQVRICIDYIIKKIEKNPQNLQDKPMSGSETASSGYKAEKIFRTNDNIRQALEKTFGDILEIEKAPHGQKSDNNIKFKSTSKNYIKIQNKKFINYGGRGDSFDRRHIKDTFNNLFIRKNLTLLTLIRPSKKNTSMTDEQKQLFISLCNNNLDDIKQYIKKTLIGVFKENKENKKNEDNEENKEHNEDISNSKIDNIKKALIGENKEDIKEDNNNDYWCFMHTDKKDSFMKLYLVKSDKLYEYIEQSINIDIKLKSIGTCLHLSPNISLQRKGGGNSDNSANHIQAKLKITQELLDICEHIL